MQLDKSESRKTGRLTTLADLDLIVVYRSEANAGHTEGLSRLLSRAPKARGALWTDTVL